MKMNKFDILIEVTVKEGDSSKERGDLLEALAKRVLVSLQHEHVKTEVRVTGCELDIIATEKQTGKKILVECKAYRDRNISADVLTKMLGNLMVHGYSSAWLICTSKLGKDASGIIESIRGNINNCDKLKVYEPDALADLLISTGQIICPSLLAIPADFLLLPSRTLLLTDIGEFWAVTAVGEKSGVADTVLIFDTVTGSSVKSAPLIQQLAERDSNLRDLTWIAGEEQQAAVSALKDEALKAELDNIASVPVADDWSDYRPARPKDFVGRDDLLQQILCFFDEIVKKNTQTRLLAIKAPSGWGKSSFLIKLRSSCASLNRKDRIFLYAVDCRTASSNRYPELALKKCFDEAILEGFIHQPIGGIRVASPGQPFSDPSMGDVLNELREKNKIIVLFFDQFEEITTKQELSDLFVQIKTLCSAVESARENIVLGFSWKTDGSIPTDHPAYHVWHSFSDRRKEFELPLFSKTDTSKLLNRLSKELSNPIEPWLRRLLAEHSQGYPWLLKKLCVHVFRVLKTQPAQQRELFERALDVEALFKKDLADLDASQMACLEKIAKESPADNFKIVEQFGDKTVAALMQRRLVLRNAGKLIVYWDIFRDYVLSKQVPAIPTRYIPVSSPATTKKALESLNYNSNTQLNALSKKLGLKKGTLDNISRDLVMMGVCQYDRKKERIKLVHAKERNSLVSMGKFFNTHVFLRTLIDNFAPGFKNVPYSSIEALIFQKFRTDDYEVKTMHVSVLRWLTWMHALGIMSVDSQKQATHNATQGNLSVFDELRIEQPGSRGAFIFKGEAAPVKVLDLLRVISSGTYYLEAEDRNSLYVLRSLRLIPSTSQPILVERPAAGVEIWLALKVSAQPSIKAARALMHSHPEATLADIGGVFEKLNHSVLSEASKRRYGNGILVWINWLNGVLVR